MEVRFSAEEGWYQPGFEGRIYVNIPQEDSKNATVDRELFLINEMLRRQRAHYVGHEDDSKQYKFAALGKAYDSEGRARYFMAANVHIYHAHDALERNCAEANVITEIKQALGPDAKLEEMWLMGGPTYDALEEKGGIPVVAEQDVGLRMAPCGTCKQKIRDHSAPDGSAEIHVLPLNNGNMVLLPSETAGQDDKRAVLTCTAAELLPAIPVAHPDYLRAALPQTLDRLTEEMSRPPTLQYLAVAFPGVQVMRREIEELEHKLAELEQLLTKQEIQPDEKVSKITRAAHAAMMSLVYDKLVEWDGNDGLLHIDIVVGRRADASYNIGIRTSGTDYPATSRPMRQLADAMAVSDENNRYTDFFALRLNGTLLDAWKHASPLDEERRQALLEDALNKMHWLDGGSIERMVKVAHKGGIKLSGDPVDAKDRDVEIHILQPVHPALFEGDKAVTTYHHQQLMPSSYHFSGDRKDNMKSISQQFDLQYRMKRRPDGRLHVDAKGILEIHNTAQRNPMSEEAQVEEAFIRSLRALITAQVMKAGIFPPGVTRESLEENPAAAIAVLVNCSGKLRKTDPSSAHFFAEVAQDAPRLAATITGGGEFGLMQAFSEHSAVAIGVTTPDINKPGFEGTSPDLDIEIQTGSVDERMYLMRALARAVTAYPGGIGTAEEIMDAVCHGRPIILSPFHHSIIRQLEAMHEAGYLLYPATAFTIPLERYLDDENAMARANGVHDGDVPALHKLRDEALTLRHRWRENSDLKNVHICGLYPSYQHHFHSRFDALSKVADAFVLLPGDIYAMRECLSAIIGKRVADKKLSTMKTHLAWIEEGAFDAHRDEILVEWSDERLDAYLVRPAARETPAMEANAASAKQRIEALRPMIEAVYHRPIVIVNEPVNGTPFWQPLLNQLALYEQNAMLAAGETMADLVQVVADKSQVPSLLQNHFRNSGAERVTQIQRAGMPTKKSADHSHADKALVPDLSQHIDTPLLLSYYNELEGKVGSLHLV